MREGLLNVLASDINTTLEASGTQERVRLQFNKDKVSIERITRTDRTFRDVDSVFILPDATFGEAHHYLVGFQNALSFIPTEDMLVAIIEAESFVSGFEDEQGDDEEQQGIGELLTKLRVLHPQYK